jgi:hypothetical protein
MAAAVVTPALMRAAPTGETGSKKLGRPGGGANLGCPDRRGFAEPQQILGLARALPGTHTRLGHSLLLFLLKRRVEKVGLGSD